MKHLIFRYFPALTLVLIFSSSGSAAFVHYTDRNGKVHYINTTYEEVPVEYQDQIVDQLKSIKQKKRGKKKTSSAGNNIIEAPADHQADSADVRLSRLNNVIQKLTSNNLLPAGVNINSGILSYRDNEGQQHPVLPENLKDVPEEYLPQIDAQIAELEKLYNKSRDEKPFIEGTPVEIYVKSDCPECEKLKESLTADKIDFIVYDVEKNNEGMAFYKTMNNAALPLTRIGSKILYGNDPYSVKVMLNSLTRPKPQVPEQNSETPAPAIISPTENDSTPKINQSQDYNSIETKSLLRTDK